MSEQTSLEEVKNTPAGEADRWTLIRDVAVLQVKLIADGFRDLVLVPVSLVAGIVSILGKTSEDRTTFYRVVCMGKQSEQWINLFGVYDNAPQSLKDEYRFDDGGIDDLVSKVETFVVNEYQSGKVTGAARQHLENALNELKKQKPGM
ncbi:MAG: hypothetical protein AAGA33_00910 [Pseudomonadota bacterium]